VRKSPGPSEGRGSSAHARKPIEKASAGTRAGLTGLAVWSTFLDKPKPCELADIAVAPYVSR
jgi:hypothetical protein